MTIEERIAALETRVAKLEEARFGGDIRLSLPKCGHKLTLNETELYAHTQECPVCVMIKATGRQFVENPGQYLLDGTPVGKSSFPALKKDCDTATGTDRGTEMLPKDMYKTGTPIHAGGPGTSQPLVDATEGMKMSGTITFPTKLSDWQTPTNSPIADTTATQTIGVTAEFSTEETVNVVNPDKWKDVQEIARLSAENADLQRRIDNSAIVIDELAAKNTALRREIAALKGNKT